MTRNEVSLERLVFALRARVQLILSFVAAGLILAGIITYATPKMYTSTSSLNFDFRGNPLANQTTNMLSENTYISTQIGIIESLHVAQVVEAELSEYERERLIAALDARRTIFTDIKRAIMSPLKSLLSGSDKSKNDDLKSEQGEALNVSSAYGWLASSIGGGLSVTPMFNSRIVEVSYSSTDRRVAALMANKFAEAYIATNLQMITDPARKSKAWFDAQLTSLRDRLEDAQSRLTQYQQEQGIVSSDERLDTENARLSDLSKQLIAAQHARRNAETERQKLQEVLASGAHLTTFKPVFENPVVQKIKAEIRDLEGMRVQYSNSLGINHPKMKKIDSELRVSHARLRSEIQTISEGIGNAAALSESREKDLRAELDLQKKLVLDLKNEHDRIAILQREVESAQATYNVALEQLNNTSMQSLVDQTSVSVVDAANIPGTHSSPKAMINLALGTLAGLLLGIGITVAMEIFGRRIYSREDLISEIGVPLLGHLKKA